MAANNKRFVAKNGLDNNEQSITNLGTAGSSLTLSGAHDITITTSGSTTLTLPTSGTLAVTGGALGSATVTTINGLTVTNTTGTLTIANGSTLATSGGNSLTFTTTGSTNVTVPTTGTLATVAGAETLSNKTIALGSNTVTGSISDFNTALTDADFATLAGSETLTNKTINGSNNTITNVSLTTGVTGTLPVANGGTGITSLGTGVATFLGTPSSANLISAITDETGTGSLVFANTPTLVTPVLGVASATSINKVALTAPATGSTLTIADGKTLTASNTLTFTGTDSSSVAFGGGGTVAYTADKLNAFAATSSTELAGVISDETGTGALVFANTPTLVTPILGTPTSGTLTNCTGLPVSGITSSTSTALGVGSIELGHATDTTIARASAGVVTIEGVNVVTVSSTDTLTNKTLTTPVIAEIDSSADITLDAAGDIILDADGADVLLKDGGTTFGAFTQSGGELVIKSGSTPTSAITMSGADVTIAGNLTVSGTTTTVNSNTVTIGDNIIVLNSDEAGTPSQNAGIEVERGTSTNASITWDESTDSWGAGLAGAEVPLVTTSGTQTLTNKTIDGSQLVAGSVANAKLTNSTISGKALGTNLDTLTMGVSGTGLSGSTTYNGSGAATFTVTSNATNANTGSTIVARDSSGNFSAGTITAALSGNASTASAWATGRTLSLTGDVTGTSASFDGSGNISISTTIAANSVALGTDTTGNYVASITNGSYITGGDGGSEGAGLTLAVDATSANTASKVVARDSSGNFSAGAITATKLDVSTSNSEVSSLNSTNVAGPYLAFLKSSTKELDIGRSAAISGVGTNYDIMTYTGLGLAFYTNNVYTPRTVITTAGDVGIGTASPAQKLHVAGDINVSSGQGFRINDGATSGQYLRGNGTRFVSSAIQAGDVPTLNQNTTGNAATATTLATARNIQGVSFNGSADITVVTAGTGVSVSGTAVSIGQSVATSATPSFDKVLATNNGNGENFKIGDDAWIGDVNAANTIRIKGVQDATAGYITFGNQTTALGSTNSTLLTWGAGFAASGEITAYYSDERLKNFSGKIEGALDKVINLNGYYYTENELAKSFGFNNDKQQVGVSAQQVQAVLPEAVRVAPFVGEQKVEEQYLTVQYEKLVPLLIEAIKQLHTEVQDLRSQMTTK